jgi:predicted acyl esterase
MNLRRTRCLLDRGIPVALLVLLATCGPRPAAPDARAVGSGDFERNVDVPMRDGVRLRADVMRPAGRGPFPTLVYRTPYDKEQERREYTTFAHALERGYAVVVQDVRGRYASEGEFRPYQQEGQDGFDTIEWAAAQAWSSGAVGTFGLSYPGAAQWMAAVEHPPHLKAMAPAMTFSSHENFIYARGPFDMSWLEWVWNDIAPDSRARRHLAGPSSFDQAVAAWSTQGPRMESVLPLERMDALREVAPFYYEWLRHPLEDPWWDWADLRSKYDRTQAAVFNLSGWYDEGNGPEGAVENFLGLLAARHGQAAGVALLIGPWVHGVKETASAVAGERRFADNAKIDYDSLVLDWMDHHLRGIANGVGSGNPIRYYVMGADTWRESREWPPAAVRTSFYLQQAGTLTWEPSTGSHTLPRWFAAGNEGAREARGVGRVAGGPEAPAGGAGGLPTRARSLAASGSSAFVSDPAHPVTNKYDDLGAYDYRELALRKDLLTFDSEPLAADTEVTGPIDAEVFVSCTCRDLDLWVRLYDVAPDGAAWNLMSPGPDVMRASYRDRGKGHQLLRPGRIYQIDVRGPVTSNLFKQSHRIRAQISGSFFPDFSRNLQSGESEISAASLRKATIRIYHDRLHSSRVVLPIVAGQ